MNITTHLTSLWLNMSKFQIVTKTERERERKRKHKQKITTTKKKKDYFKAASYKYSS